MHLIVLSTFSQKACQRQTITRVNKKWAALVISSAIKGELSLDKEEIDTNNRKKNAMSTAIFAA